MDPKAFAGFMAYIRAQQDPLREQRSLNDKLALEQLKRPPPSRDPAFRKFMAKVLAA